MCIIPNRSWAVWGSMRIDALMMNPLGYTLNLSMVTATFSVRWTSASITSVAGKVPSDARSQAGGPHRWGRSGGSGGKGSKKGIDRRVPAGWPRGGGYGIRNHLGAIQSAPQRTRGIPSASGSVSSWS